MLKKHNQLFLAILLLADLLITALSWLGAYFLRFYTGPIPVYKGIPDFEEFILFLIFFLPLTALAFRALGLYEPMRSGAKFQEIKKIIAASCLSTLVFITFLYLFKENKYSRMFFIYFLAIDIILLSLFRGIIRILLGWLRKHNYNLRYILVAGDGQLAREVAKKLTEHAEYGFKVIGFLSKDKESIGKELDGIPIIGTYGEIKQILIEKQVDQLILALPFEHIRMLRPILGEVYGEIVEIKVVPDLYEYFTLRKGIEMLDGLPVINLRESPLYGWQKLIKRLFDITVSWVILFFLSPLLIFTAILIKLTSAGPVFYKQKRMGLDGTEFEILKFRSMKIGAENQTGPVWAKENDPRRTKIGIILRRYNLDELPQFINVLKGQMSIVGPRPERPEFMHEFKKKIPEYMLRHKMKAGITGWAQINGMRGNTSLQKRTKFDLYYIENWTLSFDLKIFFKSFLATKNAY